MQCLFRVFDARDSGIGVNTHLRPYGKVLMAVPGAWCALYKQTSPSLLSVFILFPDSQYWAAGMVHGPW